METRNPIAVITGATSGIGREFATRFAGQGYDLLITGRRTNQLKEVASELSSRFGVRVMVMTGDLTDGRYRRRLCNKIMSMGNTDILVNNAGFGIDKAFHKTGIEEIRSMLFTHTIAAVELIHAVLPGMTARRRGTIINVSSLGAFIPGFTRSLYLGTKCFSHYFTEALSTELRPMGVRLQSLCPGMTTSDFHRHIHDGNLEKKMGLLPFMNPEEVVDGSLKALETGQVLCIPGRMNKVLYLLAKALPTRLLMMLSGFRKEETAGVNAGIPEVISMKVNAGAVQLRHAV